MNPAQPVQPARGPALVEPEGKRRFLVQREKARRALEMHGDLWKRPAIYLGVGLDPLARLIAEGRLRLGPQRELDVHQGWFREKVGLRVIRRRERGGRCGEYLPHAARPEKTDQQAKTGPPSR